MTAFDTRDGTRIFYHDWGSGPPVFLLNAAMMSSRMWEFQAVWLAANGLRCVSYDRRGSGRSDIPWSGYDYDTLADDVADLLAHLDLRDVTLVGYAAGGGEAVRYLSRNGSDRVAKLVLVSSTTPFLMRTDDNPDGLEPAMLEQAVNAMTGDRPQWAESIVGTFFHGMSEEKPVTAVSPQLRRWISDLALDTSPRAAVEVYRTLFRTDQRAELPTIPVPTLVIHGEADVAAPMELCGRRSSDLISGSRFVSYSDAAHGLFVTHRERLNNDLLAWVRA